jgi:hypothetical protein
MTATERVELPGGLAEGGERRREVRFRPLNGAVELAAAAAAAGANVSRRVTEILQQAVATLGGRPAGDREFAALCVADRQVLMLRLGEMLDGDRVWLTGCCESCQSPFDFSLERSAVPVTPAGATYPLAAATLRGHQVTLRVPTGADQEQLDGLDDRAALQTLLRLCLVAVDGQPPDASFTAGLAAGEIALLEQAVEVVAPAVATRLLVACPECGAEQTLRFDPYAFRRLSVNSLLREVHLLASTYHWSEAEILALPTERRHRYLGLIEQGRGLCS